MADGSIKTINIKKLVVTWGPVIFHGFADDAISIKYPEVDFEVVRGCDGEVSHNNKASDDVEITIMLKQTSRVNDQLSTLRIADKISGAGIFPFSVVDGSGTTVFFAASARIIKAPDVDFGGSVKDRTWVFGTGRADMFIGGN